MMFALDARTWWPLFPLLLLIVIGALSTGVVWAIRRKVPRIDVAMQTAALGCYLFTAVVAVANEGGGAVSANIHRLPSLLTQIVLFVQLVRIWKRPDVRPLRMANVIAWGAILADTALHYVMVRS